MRDLPRSCSPKLLSDQASFLKPYLDVIEQMLLLRNAAANVRSVPCRWNASHAGRLDPEHHVVVVESPTAGSEDGSITPQTTEQHLFKHSHVAPGALHEPRAWLYQLTADHASGGPRVRSKNCSHTAPWRHTTFDLTVYMTLAAL
jgi:hypothetical protein